MTRKGKYSFDRVASKPPYPRSSGPDRLIARSTEAENDIAKFLFYVVYQNTFKNK